MQSAAIRAATAVLAAYAAAAGTSEAQTGAASLTAAEVSTWRADLGTLATELPRRHPFLFDQLTPTRLTRAAFDSAVSDLDRRIPELARHEIVVGFQRIVAMVGAGHTSINPLFDPRLAFHYLPVQLHGFADGIFVVAADSAHASLVGARVTHVGSMAVEDALRAVGTAVSHENEHFLREYGMWYLTIPEILHATGVAPAHDAAELTVVRGGREEKVTLRSAGVIRPIGHVGQPVDRSSWVQLEPPLERRPLYRSRPEPRWVEYLPGTRTLYVSYQSAMPHGTHEAIPAFLTRVFALADSVRPERLILDVRDNSGGESFFNRQLVLGIVRRPWLDRRGGLFAVIGRATYSAAQNLVSELERYTNVTFIGEPTGSPSAFFGDHETLTLPNSGIAVNVSTLWWQAPLDPRNRRPFTAPRYFAEPTSEDFRAGRDPVLDSLDAWLARPTIAEEITHALQSGDSASAARMVAAYRARPENRYANVEPEINALGYTLLGAGRGEDAVQVFGLNVAAFPQSANAHDSMGEALERLGRRDEAVRMYRRALKIDPRFGSSRDGLRRLGAGDGAGGTPRETGGG